MSSVDPGNPPLIIRDDPATMPPEIRGTPSGRIRRAVFRTWTPARLLPDTESIFVKSWLYTAGVMTLVALIWLFISGIVLAIFGPDWWLSGGFGAWMGAMHYWAVQLFFLFMFVHFLSTFLMGAFRGRVLTWALGLLAFATAATTGLTGYSLLHDYEGQWVTTSAKDALNAAGAGSFVNLLNAGQVATIHVVVLPVIVLGAVALHVLWVRKHGIAPPYDADPRHVAGELVSP
jgi:ubiquinol-cytochrome c reductase cytochrome b subunit